MNLKLLGENTVMRPDFRPEHIILFLLLLFSCAFASPGQTKLIKSKAVKASFFLIP